MIHAYWLKKLTALREHLAAQMNQLLLGPPAAYGCRRPPSISDGDIKTSAKYHYQHKERVEYICQQYYTMEGEPFKTCINGEWTGEIRCHQNCRVPEVPASLRITTDVTGNQIRKGQHLTFACEDSSHVIKGNATIECLENGQWSNPLPTCEAAQGCGKPPPLSDGDTKRSTKYRYQHNEQVEYICQRYYIMEGGPFKTCKDGEWTGEIRCLRPCTVNREDMNRHNIQFRYSRDDKLYSEHGDTILFVCTRGSPVGTVEMRQTCENGLIYLPTCQ
ncbi:complement factor H-related protein 4-like [Pelmatolapia mariae]|uniref:complement factor H-related protein 4-like n=1 Tax=Pelmatolapia mariae TaxID=158779 RepID=UPI002FE5ED52